MNAAKKRPTSAARAVISYELTAEDEHSSPDGFLATEDPEQDKRDVAEIRRRLSRGDGWAWFCAVVTARLEVDGATFTGVDYLGCCSYTNEDEFRVGGYYDDMCDRARKNLFESVRAAVKRGDVARKVLKSLG